MLEFIRLAKFERDAKRQDYSNHVLRGNPHKARDVLLSVVKRHEARRRIPETLARTF